jgi:hypothetical protein
MYLLLQSDTIYCFPNQTEYQKYIKQTGLETAYTKTMPTMYIPFVGVQTPCYKKLLGYHKTVLKMYMFLHTSFANALFGGLLTWVGVALKIRRTVWIIGTLCIVGCLPFMVYYTCFYKPNIHTVVSCYIKHRTYELAIKHALPQYFFQKYMWTGVLNNNATKYKFVCHKNTYNVCSGKDPFVWVPSNILVSAAISLTFYQDGGGDNELDRENSGEGVNQSSGESKKFQIIDWCVPYK